jgi:carboxymethylenebutenolidase
MNKKKLIVILLLLLAVVLVFTYGSGSQTDEREAQIEITSEPEMVTESEAEYQVTSTEVAYYGDTNGYLAVPEGEGPFPALLLVHEWWGLNENIEDLANDFAEQGYVALAVDLYDGELATTPEEAGELAGRVRGDVDEAFANLSAARDYLETVEQADTDRLASVGWCFGGGWAYEMAANNFGVDASVMYYGRFSPEDDLSMMRADILGHFGEEDSSIAIDDVEQFRANLNTLDGDHAVFIYPNAGHAFANEDNEDAYNEEAAELAWQRTMDFLAEELALE